MRIHLIASLAVLLVLLPVANTRAGERIYLNGQWDFRLDPNKIGETEHWYLPGTSYDMTMTVPGVWNANGIGQESNNLFHSFDRSAWYHRKVDIPTTWKGKDIWLKFGGVRRYTDVWVNGKFAGRHIAYFTPFKFDITKQIGDGSSADIAVRVNPRQDEAIDPLRGCMDLMDMGAIVWGGIWRGVELEATYDNWIENVHVIPATASDARIIVEVGGQRQQAARLDVVAEILDAERKRVAVGSVQVPTGSLAATVRLRIPYAKQWSPRQPYLYTVKVLLLRDQRIIETSWDRFGMRRIETLGKDFLLNGKRFFLRGYGDDCVFPNTIAPPADKTEYYKRFRLAKDYGFNYVRHHSWTPPAEYFDAADELGVMLQPEFPIAYDNSYDASTPEKRKLYMDTWREVIKANWNHPSIVTWCMGNELLDGHELSAKIYRMIKEMDPTRLVIDSDGSEFPAPGQKIRQTLDFQSCGFDEGHRFGLSDSKYSYNLKPTKPVVVHEMGNSATLPSLSQLALFRNGVRPFWLYALRDLVTQNGLQSDYPKWVENSNKLQAAVLKTNIEAARISPDISGYHQWLLQDYWNGSNGVVDMFFRRKGIRAADFRKFNSPTVLLMDVPRRNYWAGEAAAIRLFVSRYEDDDSRNAVLNWELRDGRNVLARGGRKGLRVSSGGVQALCSVSIPMPAAAIARKLTFAVELADRNGRAANDWTFWVYPKDRLRSSNKVILAAGCARVRRLYPWILPPNSDEVLSHCDLLITSRVSPDVEAYLERGGRVLLLNADRSFASVASSYKPCWWLGSPGSDSNTGTVVDSSHPSVSGMASEGWCDLNFAVLLNSSRAILLDGPLSNLRPIVRCLDVHQSLRNKAYLFEAVVGKGKILASSFDLQAALSKKDPAAIYLLDRLIRYASGPGFEPKATIAADDFRKALSAPQPDWAPRAEGFTRILSCTGEQAVLQSYRGAPRRAWLVRQTTGRKRVDWVTPPIHLGRSERVSLMWTGGTGYSSQPAGAFTLYLNGKPLLEFNVTHNTARWRSADGQVELFFDVRRPSGQDSFGVMYLSVPAQLLKDGEPARLSVTGSNSSSGRSFVLFDYGDTVEYEE